MSATIILDPAMLYIIMIVINKYTTYNYRVIVKCVANNNPLPEVIYCNLQIRNVVASEVKWPTLILSL